jgi:hypothetical protein
LKASKLTIVLALLICATQHSIAQTKVPKAVLRHIQKIDSNRIKAHVAYLADDKLKGRLPGTPGYQMAVDYVVEQFKKMGLKPAGDNGTYLQKVHLRNTTIAPGQAQISFDFADASHKTANLREELNLYPHPEQKHINTTAGLVFVGRGMDVPKYNLLDYNDIDVRGKVVVVLLKRPQTYSENVNRHLSYIATIQEFAARKGAIGVILCNTNASLATFRNGARIAATEGFEAAIGTEGQRVSSSSIYGGPIQLFATVSSIFIRELFQKENLNLEKIWADMEADKYVSQPLKTTININYSSVFKEITSYNVLAKLPGSHPKLKHEYVVHSGHLDHIGISEPIAGDSINNGAHDNASGIACSLEIARMYSSLRKKPSRSILFCFLTAEEMGLLGSGYFNHYPTVAKKQLVADINTDMPTLIAPLESIAPLGAEHSGILAVVQKAAPYLGLKVEPDPDPAEGRFVRSDQYNFIKNGIPAIHIKYGYKYANPKLNLPEKVKVFRENHYHKPSDELNNSFVFSAGRTFAQVNFLVSYLIAQNPSRPGWVKGDFFEVK